MKTTTFPRAEALAMLKADILPWMRPLCQSTFYEGSDIPALLVCGSLRRKCPEVGDCDLVFISKRGRACQPGELIESDNQCLISAKIMELVTTGVLKFRKKKDGSEMNGEWNKMCEHVATGIPVDFYAATHFSFWNLVLCRTGSKEHNIKIAQRATELGWKWSPTAKSPGFSNGFKNIQILDERHAFQLLGMDYVPPESR